MTLREARGFTNNKSTQTEHTTAKASNNKYIGKYGFINFLYPDSDSDHSQNLMGSKLDQDPSDFPLGRSNQQYLHNPASKQTPKS